MTLPNFLIIGAAKSGTSSLYMYLKQHPNIFMSPTKEPHFFSFDSRSKNTRGPGDRIPQAITDINAYERLFDGVNGEKAIGESSTSYLYRPEAAKRIHALIPNVKLIAILRNPVERAFSAYMHVVRDRRETAINFAEALKLEQIRIEDNWDPIWHFTSVGFYFEQLSRYYHLFNKEKIKVYLYEDLLINQQQLFREIFQFLEVNLDFIPNSSVKFNVSGEQKSKFFFNLTSWLFNTPNPIRWVSRRLFLDIWRGNVANWIRQRNLRKHQMPPYIKRQLVKLYCDDINKLQKLINKDLSRWLE